VLTDDARALLAALEARAQRHRWAGPLAIAAALAALVAWSAWQRWTFLASSPYPFGIDGYFYPVQLRALLDDGALHYPASPLAFWLLAPFAALTDPITGAKLGAAVLGALAAVPAFLVGRRLGGSVAAGLVAAALLTPSAGSFYLSIEFVKNGVGVTVALTYLWLLLRAVEAPSAGRVVAAAVALVAAALTHKMAAGLAAWVTVPAVVAAVAARRTRRALLVGAVALAAAAVALVVIGAVASGLGARELALLDALLDDEARWAAPALQLRGGTLWLGHEALIGGALGLALVAAVALRRWGPARWRAAAPVPRPALAAALALAALAVAIALPWLDVGDPQGLGFRLRIAAFVPMALVGAALAGVVLARVAPAPRTAAVALAALVWTGAQPAHRADGMVRTHPAMVAAVRALDGELPPDAVVIIPERHILFMVAWYTRYPARLRPEAVPPSRRWRVMPLAFIGKDSPLDRALIEARKQPGLVAPIGLHPRHPNGLVAVPEPTWAWVMAQLPKRSQDHFARWPAI
jgi:hypothetical protein